MCRTFFYRIPVVRHKFIRVYSSCRRQKGKPASCAGCDYCGREPALPAFSTDAHPPRMRLCCLVFSFVFGPNDALNLIELTSASAEGDTCLQYSAPHSAIGCARFIPGNLSCLCMIEISFPKNDASMCSLFAQHCAVLLQNAPWHQD